MDLTFYLFTLIWTILLFVLSGAMDWLGAQTFGRAYWIIVAPGVAIHELSHWLACKITCTKVHDVVLFSRDGGHVTHDKRGFLVSAFIGTAPLFVGIALLVLLGQLFLKGGLDDITLNKGIWTMIKDMGTGIFKYIWENEGYKDWRFYLYLYAAFTLMATLAPSGQDLKNSAIGLIVIFAVMVGLVALRTTLDLPFWTKNVVVDAIAEGLLQFVGWGLMAFVLALLVILPIYIIKRVIMRP